MKATRTKRMAGFVGLLAALTLAVSGCSVIGQSVSQPENQFVKSAPAPKIDESWTKLYGKDDQKTPKEVAAAGVNIMSVMFNDFPQFTVNGFVPTDKDWNDVQAKMKPLVTPTTLILMQNAWTNKKELPTLVGFHVENGKHVYSTTAADGKICTAPDKPGKTTMSGVTLLAKPDSRYQMTAVFSGSVTVSVSCKEGGTLQGQSNISFPMTNDGHGWVMEEEPTQESNAKWVMVK